MSIALLLPDWRPRLHAAYPCYFVNVAIPYHSATFRRLEAMVTRVRTHERNERTHARPHTRTHTRARVHTTMLLNAMFKGALYIK